MTDAAPSELLTVAEAAARLSVSIPRLRRLLARPEFARYTTSQARETKTGTRTSLAVPVSVLPLLADGMERERTKTAESFPFSFGAEDGAAGTKETGGAMPALAAALLTEKDARIDALTGALEHERNTTRRLTEALEQAQANLQREQSLRLLTHTEAQELAGPQTEAAPEDSGDFSGFSGTPTRAGEGEPSEVSDKKKGWWTRLWKGRA
jgi:hypothetical protein